MTKAQSELEQHARELETSGQYKSEFLANMSHELRTPLNSLLLLARDLAENKKENLDQEQVESAEVIYKSGQELLQLIDEILDLAKIEAGQMTLQIDEVHLQEVAREIEQSFSHLARRQGLQFHIHLFDTLPPRMQTDEQRLRQILANLLSNALKFTHQGSVTIRIHQPEPTMHLAGTNDLDPAECIAFSVEDTGIGIPKEKHPLVFEAFQQAEGSTTRQYGGTGLGLSISREMARLLGGEIQLVSEPGKGSTFTLYLPTTHEPVALEPQKERLEQVERTEQKNPSRRTSSTANTELLEDKAADTISGYQIPVPDDRDHLVQGERHILVIEDDQEFAKILLKRCRARGFKTLAAPNGEMGLELAATFNPTAVILDIRLPGISGDTVLRTLKENPATRHIPVHILSGLQPTRATQLGEAIGITAKPATSQDIEGVFDKIEQVVDKKVKDLLLVEDNAVLRMGIKKLFDDPDLNIVETDSGQGALTALRERQFDCIILDIGLPDMNGFELLDQLSETGPPKPPVIVYTGRELTREDEMELRRHAETIIVKGVKSEERLLDEVGLFLHKTVSGMPPTQQSMLFTLREQDAILRGKTVLLVDDDMRNLFALSKVLSEKGLTVIKAEDGQKALELLDSHPDIVLVLLDIMMPVMDGFETARQIRLQPRFRDLPIIALTAKALKEDRNRCIEAGANDYLAKPVDVDRLFSMLRVWLYRQEHVL